MEIKYLKDAPLGKKGQIATVLDHEAKVLINLGFAEPTIKTETLLLNPNGTAVIDDFGSLITVKKPKNTGKSAKKGE